MNNYKNLEIWKQAMELVVEVYKLTKKFPFSERFGLTHQVQKSAVSIPSNIAEGAGRRSKNEFSHFLGISNGSGAELETQLIISFMVGYINESELENIQKRIQINQKMNHNLTKTLI
jgi:four helix bundle protein